MRAFAHTIGVRIENKAALENRLDDIAQCVMRDAVAKRRGADQAALRLVNVKAGVSSRLISLGAEFFLQAQQIVFQTIFKRGNVGMAALAGAGFFVSRSQVVPGSEFVVHF